MPAAARPTAHPAAHPPAQPLALPAAHPPAPADWQARLALHFVATAGRTRMAAVHAGPLRVQKALYPEGPGVCHAIVLHPPGGIAGGDRLELQVQVDRGAHALLTTPGASRWYKAAGRCAGQRVRLRVAAGGVLEWLPQETLVYDAAQAEARLELDLAADAGALGWEVVGLGRAAGGERFDHGRFVQDLSLRVDGALVWREPTRLDGGDPLLASPLGLAGRRVFGCLWAWGPPWTDELLEAARAALAVAGAGDGSLRAGVSRLEPRLLVARVLANHTAAARAALEALWRVLRPSLGGGRAAVAPRIWAT